MRVPTESAADDRAISDPGKDRREFTSSNSFVVDVCPQNSSESASGYPRYANNEARAHVMAEEAAQELASSGNPGEYLVMVRADQTPVATQVVVVEQ